MPVELVAFHPLPFALAEDRRFNCLSCENSATVVTVDRGRKVDVSAFRVLLPRILEDDGCQVNTRSPG